MNYKYPFQIEGGDKLDTGISIYNITDEDQKKECNKRMIITIIGSAIIAGRLHEIFIEKVKQFRSDSKMLDTNKLDLCVTIHNLLNEWGDYYSTKSEKEYVGSKNFEATDPYPEGCENNNEAERNNKKIGEYIKETYSEKTLEALAKAMQLSHYEKGKKIEINGDAVYKCKDQFYATLVSSTNASLSKEDEIFDKKEKKHLTEFLNSWFSKVLFKNQAKSHIKTIYEKEKGKELKCGVEWNYDELVECIVKNPNIKCTYGDKILDIQEIIERNNNCCVSNHKLEKVARTIGNEDANKIDLLFFYLSFIETDADGIIHFNIDKGAIPCQEDSSVSKKKEKRTNEVSEYQSKKTDCDFDRIKERQYAVLSGRQMACYGNIGELNYIDLYEKIDDETIIQRIEKTMSNGKILFLYGSAGFGKTTTMLQLYKNLYEDRNVFFVDGRILANGEKFDEIPLEGMGAIPIDESNDCIYLIDAVDEYINSSNIKRFIDRINGLSIDSTVIVSGRKDIFKALTGLTKNIMPVKMELSKDGVSERLRYLGLNPEQFNLADNSMTPLMLALIDKYFISTGKKLELDRNGKVKIWELVESVIDGMMESIPITPSITLEELHELDLKKTVFIISEYSWIRYSKGNRLTYGDMIKGTVKETGLSEGLVKAVLNMFTDAGRGGEFIHKTIEDYFLAMWMNYEVEEKNSIRKRYLVRMLNTDIQRLIGDRIANDDGFAKKIVDWYCDEITATRYSIERAKDEKDVGKYHEKSTLLFYQLGRSIIVLDEGDTKKKASEFIYAQYQQFSRQPWYPEIMTLTNILIQSRDMSVEEFTYDMLTSDERFARIIRACYLFYLGDVPFKSNPGLNDVPDSDAKNMCRTILRDMASDDIRHLCLTRCEVVLLRQLIDQGYSISDDIIGKIASIDSDANVKHVMNNDTFKKILREQKIDENRFEKILEMEIKLLCSAAESHKGKKNRIEQ